MADRLLDFAEKGAFLRVQDAQLRVERGGALVASVPVKEIAVIILAHPRVTCTQSLFCALMESGGALVTCDRQHLPAGMLLPTAGHFAQAERFAAQASAKQPRKKRVWKQIVRQKILAQADTLATVRGETHGLRELAKQVRSGDPSNVEAQAARRYWGALFAEDGFRRRREGGGANSLLNYGYAVLRAIVARAICAAGLHPSLGVHHHNRYNAYCLADDLMEPYRPLVDEVVVELVGSYGADVELDRTTKPALLEAVGGRYCADGEVRSTFDLAARTASSLAQVFLGESGRVWYPRELGRAGG